MLALLVAACADPPASLLLISVDTLRADRLGAYGSERGLTPRLDALASESLVFGAAYAPAPFTFPSIASMLTGRYPEELGIYSNRSAVPDDAPTLAGLLRDRGFATAAVVSNFVLRDKAGLAPHFDVYDDTMEQREVFREWPERVARHTTDAALAALASLPNDAPWFLWVHYQDPHGPYTPPAGLRERFLEAERREPGARRQLPARLDSYGHGGLPAYQELDGEREIAFYRAGYNAEVAYVDVEIGRLLDALTASGQLGDAVVVFTADHGEALGEFDYWFSHGHHLTDELVRVPLLMRVPGVPAGRRDDVVSLVDLFPTLAALAGAGRTDTSGRDLLAAGASARDSVPYLATLGAAPEPRYGIVADDYKLILTHRDDLWRSQLHRRGRDQIDLSAPAPQIARRLRGELAALRRRFVGAGREHRQQLTPEEEQGLHALGYLDPTAAP